MVPQYSVQISRVRTYFGYCRLASVFTYMTLTFFGSLSQVILLCSAVLSAVHTPDVLLLPVWPPPRSLATTCGISVDVFSSSYLDVSVRKVPRVRLFYSAHAPRFFITVVSQFGYLRIRAYLQLPAAFRSLSRPSSAPNAKAFSLCSF